MENREHIPIPSRAGMLGEAGGLLELPRLALRWPQLIRQPGGDGQPVMVVPGFGASDRSTSVLRRYLCRLGYQAIGWGLGRNTGRVPTLLPQIIEQLTRQAERAGEPVHLIGWSLGGYLVREAARDHPAAARQVITLGSPVVGGPKYTVVAGHYRRHGIDMDAIEAQVDERYAIPLTTPVTAIYSRQDRVVSWQACIDHRSPNVEHIEVRTTHIGLGFSPDVLGIIATRLAR